MANVQTEKETKEFFEKNNYFGIEKSNVHIFSQPMNPGIDFNSKFLLESKD